MAGYQDRCELSIIVQKFGLLVKVPSLLFFGGATALCYSGQRSFTVNPELRKKHEVSYEAAGFSHPASFVRSDRELS